MHKVISYVCKCHNYDEDIITQFNFEIDKHDIHIKPKFYRLERLEELVI